MTSSLFIVSDIAVFVLKRDVKLQPTNEPSVFNLVAALALHLS